MASLFETYEKQYGTLTGEITLNLSRIPNLKDDERKQTVHETSVLFDETRDLIEQMSLEILELPNHLRQKYTGRLACYRSELEKLSSEFNRPRYAPYSLSHTKQNQHFGAEDNMHEEILYDSDMRTRLLENTERSQRSTKKLEDGLHVALQTEEVGGHILSDLSEQRDKLQRSRHRLRQADEDLSKSSRILTEMTRRIFKNRILLWGIILFLILIFIIIIYLSVKPSLNSSAAPLPTAASDRSNSIVKSDGNNIDNNMNTVSPVSK